MRQETESLKHENRLAVTSASRTSIVSRKLTRLPSGRNKLAHTLWQGCSLPGTTSKQQQQKKEREIYRARGVYSRNFMLADDDVTALLHKTSRILRLVDDDVTQQEDSSSSSGANHVLLLHV